jgi:integrase
MPHTLTASQIAKLETPGLYRAERGLYLQVRPNGAKSWLVRYQLDGRRRMMGIGPVRLVPLTEARARALRAQRDLLDGIDPIDARRARRVPVVAPKVVPTFIECAAAYVRAHRDAWSNPKHLEQWERTIASYAGPVIGSMAVDAISVDDMVKVLEPIWTTKSETAGRLRGRVEKVLGWAEAAGHRSGPNPAAWRGPLGHMLPPLSKVKKVEHHDAAPYDEVPALLAAITAKTGTTSAALAFTLLTAARSGEVRGMRWSEIDCKAKVWTVPANRMKARKEHRVPLSDEALALLPAKDGPPNTLVFAGTKRGQPLSDMTLLKAIRVIRGKTATVHGLRSSFSTWAAEKTDYPREVVEAALAHQIADAVEAAYKRTTFFEKRASLMADWAAFCRSKHTK